MAQVKVRRLLSVECLWRVGSLEVGEYGMLHAAALLQDNDSCTVLVSNRY